MRPIAAILLTALATAAHACPVCDSPTAHEVRSGLAADITPQTLAAIVLPFITIAGVVLLIHCGLPSWRKKLPEPGHDPESNPNQDPPRRTPDEP